MVVSENQSRRNCASSAASSIMAAATAFRKLNAYPHTTIAGMQNSRYIRFCETSPLKRILSMAMNSSRRFFGKSSGLKSA